MNHDHLKTTVGRRFPKAWIMGKTLAQIEKKKPKTSEIDLPINQLIKD